LTGRGGAPIGCRGDGEGRVVQEEEEEDERLVVVATRATAVYLAEDVKLGDSPTS
jgi:hypothetical protein